MYEKGGSDFRTPWNTSSFGRQVLGRNHTKTAGKAVIGSGPRFEPHTSAGPGPNMPPASSLQKQLVSKKATAPSTCFGTSTRDAALKLYAVYTV